MTTPIFEELKITHGFDPLEHVEYETISDRAGHVVREVAIWRAGPYDYPTYKATYDPGHELWALMKGQWSGPDIFVYQPCGYYPNRLMASNAAAIKNEIMKGLRF